MMLKVVFAFAAHINPAFLVTQLFTISMSALLILSLRNVKTEMKLRLHLVSLVPLQGHTCRCWLKQCRMKKNQ